MSILLAPNKTCLACPPEFGECTGESGKPGGHVLRELLPKMAAAFLPQELDKESVGRYSLEKHQDKASFKNFVVTATLHMSAILKCALPASKPGMHMDCFAGPSMCVASMSC